MVKRRILRVLCIALAVAVAGLLYYLLVRWISFGIPCAFYQITGLSCPGCGLTRAITALLAEGDLALALSYNQMLPLYAVYGAWFVATVTVRYVKGERDVMLVGPGWIHALMLVIAVAFGIVRNII